MRDATSIPDRPRLVPEVPLPSDRYVPGRNARPTSLPLAAASAPPDPERWRECREYLFGIDLFNAGFYWEAHEIWEGLWHAAGRHGTVADFLKGLIALAAAGVKANQCRRHGVARHARRASDCFTEVRRSVGDAWMGFDLDRLTDFAKELAAAADHLARPSAAPAEHRYLPIVLDPTETGA